MSLDNIKDFLENAPHMSTRELAERYNIDEETVRLWKTKEDKETKFPPSVVGPYNKFITVNSDKTLILSDIEIPCHDHDILDISLELSKKFKLDTLIINGDFIALDSFSAWAKSTVSRIAFSDEKEPAIQILKVFLRHFPRVVIVTGNHERRLPHLVDGHISVGTFFTTLAGVEFSEYAFCYLRSGGKKFLCCHQDNYSKTPLTVARGIASIHHINVISGHCHHLAQGYDVSGKFTCIDGGSARASDRTWYKASRVNLFPSWVLGGVMVIEGNPYLFNKDNYKFYMGL